jgi:putative intracellular protease/amidase
MKVHTLLFPLIAPVLLFSQTVKPAKKKILVVVSSYGKKEGKLRPGFEFDEFSQAWLIFKANGLDVEVASPKGGFAEPDEFNKTKPYNKQVFEDAKAMALLRNTKPTAQIKPEQYAAVYIVGGKGAMFDLPFDPSLQEIVAAIYQKQQGVVAAVCHGPAAFVNVKLDDGTFLIANKTVTGFCNDEEEKFGKKWKAEFPFLLEDKLKARGALYERSEAMLPQVSTDGRLITGQNPYSTLALAEEIVKALGLTPVKREPYADERSMHLVKQALKGELQWVQQEITANHKLYDVQLIGVYGYYKLINAKENTNEVTASLQIIELVTPWVFNENLQYEMAKGYLQLKNKEKAKTLLQEIITKQPSFADAKKLLDEIK